VSVGKGEEYRVEGGSENGMVVWKGEGGVVRRGEVREGEGRWEWERGEEGVGEEEER